MAIRFDSVSDRMVATGLDYNNAYSILLWVYLVTDRNAWGTICSVNDNASNFDSLKVNATGLTLAWGVQFTGDTLGSDLSVATWQHIALVRTSNANLTVYKSGVLEGSPHTTSVSGRSSSTRTEINGVTAAGTEWMDMRTAAIKVYSAALTADEILVEMQQYAPKRTNNLFLFSPSISHSDIVDYSGSGNSFSASGSLTTEDGPPIPWNNTLKSKTLFKPGTQYTQELSSLMFPFNVRRLS